MTQWLQRILIAAAAFWAGLVAMNFYWYTVWHTRSDGDWIVPVAMATVPLLLALVASAVRWPGWKIAA